MTKHTWCPICDARILTIEEEQKYGICWKCREGKKHANNFHKKYDIDKEDDKNE